MADFTGITIKRDALTGENCYCGICSRHRLDTNPVEKTLERKDAEPYTYIDEQPADDVVMQGYKVIVSYGADDWRKSDIFICIDCFKAIIAGASLLSKEALLKSVTL